MEQSRRRFLTVGAATLGATTIGTVGFRIPGALASGRAVSGDEVAPVFAGLPGNLAVKIFAPATQRTPEVLIAINATQQVFIGSAFKTFVLAERLRQLDGPDVGQRIATQEVALDESVFSVSSSVFNPPKLTGIVSERTAMEAMISHSDNTGTDMVIKATGIENVRRFVASTGLTHTLVPSSTRTFFGYIFGAANAESLTWDQLLEVLEGRPVHSPLNQVQTMASTASELVWYHSRALHGEFFSHEQTLDEYRAILSIADAIWLLPFPLGASAFCKAGSIDVPGFHALCVPGAIHFDDVWVYFCFALNWDNPAETDPDTFGAFAEASSRALHIVKEALQK